MLIHVVQNTNGIIMGAFKTHKEGATFARKIGKKRWNEDWSVKSTKLGEIEAWILAGGESYRAEQKLCKKCKHCKGK